MVTGIVVISFNSYVYPGFPKFLSKAFASAIVGFYFNTKMAVESVVYFGKGIDIIGSGLKGSGFKHALIYVLYETVISVCYKVSDLAAS